MHLAYWRWRNLRGERWWVTPSQCKNLNFMKTPDIHSLMDGGNTFERRFGAPEHNQCSWLLKYFKSVTFVFQKIIEIIL
jgi:hypothetical protein